MRCKQRGMALLELMLASGLLLLLLGCCFGLCSAGMQGWSRADLGLDAMQKARNFSVRWRQELSEASVNSLSTNAAAVSFGSARDSDGRFRTTLPALQPLWQRFVLYSWRSSDKALLRREVALSAEQESLGRLEDTMIGGVVRPLAFYSGVGTPVLERLGQLTVERDGAFCRLQFTLQLSGYATRAASNPSFSCSASCRN